MATIKTFEGDAISDEMVDAAAALFSNNYGVWGPLAEARMGPFARQGQRIRMSPARLRQQCLPSGGRNILVRCSVGVDEKLVGHVCASRWMYQGRQVCWITQLCVDKGHRRQGLATMVGGDNADRLVCHGSNSLQMLKAVREGADDAAVGILSSHPAALLATLRAFGSGTGAGGNVHAMAKEHARTIMSSSPVEYVRIAMLHGSVFEDQTAAGVVSCADTGFYVDHGEPMEVLDGVLSSGRAWPYGTLPEGHEFLVLIRGAQL